MVFPVTTHPLQPSPCFRPFGFKLTVYPLPPLVPEFLGDMYPWTPHLSRRSDEYPLFSTNHVVPTGGR
eukprot:316000-Hanusia_phi.AAC.1